MGCHSVALSQNAKRLRQVKTKLFPHSVRHHDLFPLLFFPGSPSLNCFFPFFSLKADFMVYLIHQKKTSSRRTLPLDLVERNLPQRIKKGQLCGLGKQITGCTQPPPALLGKLCGYGRRWQALWAPTENQEILLPLSGRRRKTLTHFFLFTLKHIVKHNHRRSQMPRWIRWKTNESSNFSVAINRQLQNPKAANEFKVTTHCNSFIKLVRRVAPYLTVKAPLLELHGRIYVPLCAKAGEYESIAESAMSATSNSWQNRKQQ